MHPNPTECDGALDPSAEVVATASCCKKRRILPRDVNPTVLHGFDAIREIRFVCPNCSTRLAKLELPKPSVPLQPPG